MQFRDLKTQYQVLKDKINPAVEKVMTDCNFIMGQQVKDLEKKLADYVGVKHCLTCANGTDALQLAVMAMGIGKGDVVFVPDFTFFASGEIVSLVGAKPIFVDVDEDTFNISPSDLVKKIDYVLKENIGTPKAIVAVDLFGLPANYIELKAVAEKYGLYVIEDAAQGFGGEISGKRACSFGDISTTSFFPAKPLGCYGDGGAIFTDNDEWAELINSYRVHGKGSFKYDNVRIGLNSRLDTIQAAVLDIKMDAFTEYELRDINKVAEKYTELLSSVAATPVVPDGFLSSWAQYTIKLENKEVRNNLQIYLKEKNIPSMVYYPKPMHLQKAFDENSFVDECPVTVKLADTVLSLPMHPYLTDDEIAEVVKEIKSFL